MLLLLMANLATGIRYSSSESTSISGISKSESSEKSSPRSFAADGSVNLGLLACLTGSGARKFFGSAGSG